MHTYPYSSSMSVIAVKLIPRRCSATTFYRCLFTLILTTQVPRLTEASGLVKRTILDPAPERICSRSDFIGLASLLTDSRGWPVI